MRSARCTRAAAGVSESPSLAHLSPLPSPSPCSPSPCSPSYCSSRLTVSRPSGRLAAARLAGASCPARRRLLRQLRGHPPTCCPSKRAASPDLLDEHSARLRAPLAGGGGRGGAGDGPQDGAGLTCRTTSLSYARLTYRDRPGIHSPRAQGRGELHAELSELRAKVKDLEAKRLKE